MLNKIFNGDCLELLKDVPNNSIDFVIGDLPYGLTNCAWDKKIDLQKLWAEINRVTKFNAAMAFFSCGKFLIELAASNLKNYRYKIVWEKNLACGFLNANKMPLRAHEDILIFYRKLPTYNPQFTKGKPYIRVCGSKSSRCYGKKKPARQKVTVNAFRQIFSKVMSTTADTKQANRLIC